ncbi:glycosyltransferase family 2 protein [Opitutus terrae]|uniref:Glycosyl transferase family 2 n=1 Tax=Opitutus terrae (strain DSM 11246 / JCM 15787 / PB90-1) TaxID=452637 RepID=B1ZW30_OPITP|nr:glycosyltransferase [Opitutus terrae]ACB76044.1 glycosyl transferase family 2 [Opitutus terrae PB90-1]
MSAVPSGPLVSVVMAAYNAAIHVVAALDSVAGQTWPHIEIIVVDDGSTDGTPAILAHYSQFRGIQIITQSNRGQCAALNRGLAAAKGEFIKFLDSDDLLSPNAIAVQVAALQDRPGLVAYGEWARFHTEPKEAQFRRRPGWHDAGPIDWLVEIWDDGQPMMQCGQFLVPHALLARTGGWDERLSLVNDFEFFARVVLASSGVVFTPAARLYYRSGMPDSLSGQKSGAAWASAARSLTLGTDYLLAAENSARTRRAAAAVLQELAYSMYPSAPNLVRQLEQRIAALGGCPRPPQGGSSFRLARRLIGWKAARWLQIAAGKYPAPE